MKWSLLLRVPAGFYSINRSERTQSFIDGLQQLKDDRILFITNIFDRDLKSESSMVRLSGNSIFVNKLNDQKNHLKTIDINSLTENFGIQCRNL